MKKLFILLIILLLIPFIKVNAELGGGGRSCDTIELKCSYSYSTGEIIINYSNNAFSFDSTVTKIQENNITSSLVLGNFEIIDSGNNTRYTCPKKISADVEGLGNKSNNAKISLYEYKENKKHISLSLNTEKSSACSPIKDSDTMSCKFRGDDNALVIITYNYTNNTYNKDITELSNGRALGSIDEEKLKTYFLDSKNSGGCNDYYFTCPNKKNATCTLFSKSSDSTSPNIGEDVKNVDNIYKENILNISIDSFTGLSCADMLAEMPLTMEYLNKAFKFIKIIAPILVIVYGTLDYAKVVFADKDDSLKKANSTFLKRIIAAVIIFLLPFILTFIINVVPGLNTSLCGVGM